MTNARITQLAIEVLYAADPAPSQTYDLPPRGSPRSVDYTIAHNHIPYLGMETIPPGFGVVDRPPLARSGVAATFIARPSLPLLQLIPVGRQAADLPPYRRRVRQYTSPFPYPLVLLAPVGTQSTALPPRAHRRLPDYTFAWNFPAPLLYPRTRRTYVMWF